MRSSHGRITSAAFGENRPQHAQTVAERGEIAGAVDTGMLETGHLDDGEACHGDAYGDQRLDLEAVTPQPFRAVPGRRRGRIQPKHGQVPPPEDVEAVAQIRI